MARFVLLVALVAALFCGSNAFKSSTFSRRVLVSKLNLAKDAQGYLIKPRDWFNGLSLDPGNSLADPRSVPPVCKEFAEKIKAGAQVTFAETIKLIDEHYDYFAVSFTNGDILNKANENTGSAKVFSFALMTQMDEAATLRLFGEIYRDLKPDGSDHPNIRQFAKKGWTGVTFGNGLTIASKLSSYTDTDSAFATQASIEGESGWDADSDSWIP